MKHVVALLSLALLLPADPLVSQEVALPDFELAQDAVARGEILSLAEVLARVVKVHPGQVLEVELEYSRGLQVYEIDLLTPDGRLFELDVAARSGDILALEEENDD